jgi:plastocyanin
MLHPRGWLLVLGIPVVLTACSTGGSSGNALGLGASPSLAVPAVPSAGPPGAHPAATAKPTRSTTPTPTHSGSTAATHSAAPKPKTTHPPTHKATPSPTNKASTLTISTFDFYFSPATPTVPVGTKVTIYNPTMDSHTWTSGSKGVPSGPFNSGALGYKQTYTYTFTKPGTYNFFCQYHGSTYGMKGHITVT